MRGRGGVFLLLSVVLFGLGFVVWAVIEHEPLPPVDPGVFGDVTLAMPRAPLPVPLEIPTPAESGRVRVIGEAEQQRAWASHVERRRDEWIAFIESSAYVQSVDRLEFADLTLIVAVSSSVSGDGWNRDVAWDIVRDLRDLWTEDAWPLDVGRNPVWHKALRLVANDLLFDCDGHTMRMLAERRLERSQWESACLG